MVQWVERQHMICDVRWAGVQMDYSDQAKHDQW